VATGNEVIAIKGSSTNVSDVVFTPDSKYICIASQLESDFGILIYKTNLSFEEPKRGRPVGRGNPRGRGKR
jgi:hypothetical protein